MKTSFLKKIFPTIFGIVIFAVQYACAQNSWKPIPVALHTRWASQVDPNNVLTEYPRPQMRRDRWKNLNGLWDYAVTGKDSVMPDRFDGKILVPFPIESSLSGVKKPLMPDQRLWYRRSIEIDGKKNERWLLHFGEVDWEAIVMINGHQAGMHRGGYAAFSYDITPYLKRGSNELVVSVWDPTDKSKNAYGKQSLTPHTTWYTATSGIWQTVWLEPVAAVSISDLSITPDIDRRSLQLTVGISGDISRAGKEYSTEVVVSGSGRSSIAIKGLPGVQLDIPVEDPHLWSPKDPFLYDLVVRLLYKGKIVDSVASYFGMRKIQVKKDSLGFDRIFLNDRYVFNLGTLDQGFWPEGCYTAPTDSALFFDIMAEKEMGFNTIRKHLKVEPARWYYHCDRLGMLVWQDVPARYPRIDSSTDTKEARAQFEWEMKEEFRLLHNYPSIVMWILFNEDWALYDKERLEAWARQADPSRLLNSNTGSKKNPGLSGDFSVIHHYCYPVMPPRIAGKASILGEFGGITDVVEDHDWVPGKQWGHGEVMPGIDFQNIYEDMMRRIEAFEKMGLSGSIFTQPYDVEQEKCGLMTYDRSALKIPMDAMRWINALLVK